VNKVKKGQEVGIALPLVRKGDEVYRVGGVSATMPKGKISSSGLTEK